MKGLNTREVSRTLAALASGWLLLITMGATWAATGPAGDGRDGTREPGDVARGRAIVVDRQLGMCLLCHSGPFPEEPSMGNLAPDLTGAGSRWSRAQLRERIADPTRLIPGTIMPAYSRSDGLWRVPVALRGQALLNADQIDDVVAFLATLVSK